MRVKENLGTVHNLMRKYEDIIQYMILSGQFVINIITEMENL